MLPSAPRWRIQLHSGSIPDFRCVPAVACIGSFVVCTTVYCVRVQENSPPASRSLAKCPPANSPPAKSPPANSQPLAANSPPNVYVRKMTFSRSRSPTIYVSIIIYTVVYRYN